MVFIIFCILWPIWSPPLPQNQCIFVRGYRISVRPRALAKLMGQIKVSPMEETDPDDVFHVSNIGAGQFHYATGQSSSWFGAMIDNVGRRQRTHATHEYLEANDQRNSNDPSNEVFVEAAPAIPEVTITRCPAACHCSHIFTDISPIDRY